MKTLNKSLITLGVTSALMVHQAHAATYEVIDLGLVDTVKNTFGIKQNNLGEAVVFGNGSYNFPVQFDLLDEDDFESIRNLAENQHERFLYAYEITDQQFEDLKAGNPDSNALWWTVNWLRSQSPQLYQTVGDSFIFKFDGTFSEPITLFDKEFTSSGQLSRSTQETPSGITDNGWIFGYSSAPYLPLEPFLEEDAGDDDEPTQYWVRDFNQRGFIRFNDGTTVELTPLEDLYGGISQIYDINVHGQVVGSSSVGFNEEELEDLQIKCILDEVDGEENEDKLTDIPQELCIFREKSTIYQQRAVQWNLDANGQLVGEPTLLGTAVDNNRNPEDERTGIFSIANAINDSGIAVGITAAWLDADETQPADNEYYGYFAAVFKGDEVIEFTDRDEFYTGFGRTSSEGLAINNNGMMTGYMNKFVNGSLRKKVFYADTNAETIETQLVEDFFPGSSSIGFSINNNNIIVGEGEYESFNDRNSPRRRHGFMYHIDTDKFVDINDLLSCDSQYTIIEARDINDANEIVATAMMKQPLRDAKGQLIYDENGDEVLEDVFRAVYLRPIEGDIEDCGTIEEKVERQGAGLNLLWLAGLGLLTLFRRSR
ncbi:DUF3466 family protein [Thalassotalea mangrovi]|uniref:DUF3466 family protein n=1 Tax=Thalassotalea mangrovi TaxID=2572245 RepID=A0A4U1B583_9GAMM|nr:DUF3466 family protein [Thalassotalea mangrovi]TKB44754.1 DUF3466 family protein [Thalassotalea mangrovi]